MMTGEEGVRIDALLPPEMARRASEIGVRKAGPGLLPMFSLAVLAGAFIALGAAFATTVAAGSMAVKGPTGRRSPASPSPMG